MEEKTFKSRGEAIKYGYYLYGRTKGNHRRRFKLVKIGKKLYQIVENPHKRWKK